MNARRNGLSHSCFIFTESIAARTASAREALSPSRCALKDSISCGPTSLNVSEPMSRLITPSGCR